MEKDRDQAILFLHHARDLIIFFRGAVKADHSFALYEKLEHSLGEGGVDTLYLDLHDSDYIDSTTVGTLIKLKKLQESHGARCVLTNLSDPVREILAGMKLLSYFSVAESTKVRELEDQVVNAVPLDLQEKVSSAFVLDAHHDIVRIVPELREEFETLFKALENATGKS